MPKIWETINNPGFKPVEFDGFKKLAGLNSFTLTPKQWIERRGAIGLISKAGRYGGTYAHKDIAFVYASEADVLNMALFGKTAAHWRGENSGESGNIQDEADSALLVYLSNLENLNELFISEGQPQGERLRRLNQIAIQQTRIFAGDERLPMLDANKAGDNAQDE